MIILYLLNIQILIFELDTIIKIDFVENRFCQKKFGIFSFDLKLLVLPTPKPKIHNYCTSNFYLSYLNLIQYYLEYWNLNFYWQFRKNISVL